MQGDNVTTIQAALAVINDRGREVFIQSSNSENTTPDIFTISLAPRVDGVEFNGIEITSDAIVHGMSVIQLVQVAQDRAVSTLRFDADVEVAVLADAIEHLFGIAAPAVEVAISMADEDATEEALEAFTEPVVGQSDTPLHETTLTGDNPAETMTPPIPETATQISAHEQIVNEGGLADTAIVINQDGFASGVVVGDGSGEALPPIETIPHVIGVVTPVEGTPEV